MELQLSDAEKIYIIHGAQEGTRADGRGPMDYRQMMLECGALVTTHGSARVRLDCTDLLIGVKAELIVVPDMATYRNRINFFVDCSANATPLFAGRGGEEFADELTVALDAAYDNEYAIPDLKKLIVSPMHAWKLYVDIVILQYGGNIIDAAAIGVKTALHNTEISDVIVHPADEGKVAIQLPEDNTVWKLDVSRLPLFVCVNRLGSAKIVDNSLMEEACTQAALWIAVVPPASVDQSSKEAACDENDFIITFMRQCGGGSLEMDSLEDMINLGLMVAKRLHTELDRRLKHDCGFENPMTTFLR